MTQELSHTPGNWSIGKVGSIVSDNHSSARGCDPDVEEFYGGHFICESVSGPDARLIAAAPALLKALAQTICNDCGCRMGSIQYPPARMTCPSCDQQRKVLAKASEVYS